MDASFEAQSVRPNHYAQEVEYFRRLAMGRVLPRWQQREEDDDDNINDEDVARSPCRGRVFSLSTFHQPRAPLFVQPGREGSGAEGGAAARRRRRR